jgi:DNA-binding CsgD family transcriptional regulator
MTSLHVTFRSADGREGSAHGEDVIGDAGLTAFLEGFLRAASWVVRVSSGGADAAAAEADALGARSMVRARCGRLTRESAGGGVLEAAVRVDGAIRCLMNVVWRDAAASARAEAEADRIAATVASLATVAAAARQRQLLSASLTQALDRLDLALAVVGGDGAVIFANAAAMRLPIVEQRAAGSGRARPPALTGAVATALRAGGGDAGPIGLGAADPARAVFVARLGRAAPPHAADAGAPPAPNYVIVAPAWAATDDEKAVAAVFGLTGAEARVALQIAAGLSVSQTAARLALRSESVRTYLKRIYEKLGVSRQNELAALVARRCPPILAAAAPAPAVAARLAAADRAGQAGRAR